MKTGNTDSKKKELLLFGNTFYCKHNGMEEAQPTGAA
jgi:hypothetical protein